MEESPGPLDQLNLPASNDALFFVPPIVAKWSAIITQLNFALYKNPGLPIALDPEEMPFFQLLVKLSPEPEKAAARPRETTFNFNGSEALEGMQFIVHTNIPDRNLTQLLSFFNFFYNSGAYSDYDNQSERFAAVISTYLHIVNTALIALLRQTFGRLMNPEDRLAAEEMKGVQAANPQSTPTFSIETFREGINTTLANINQLQATLAKNPDDEEAIMQLLHLLGRQPSDEEMEDLATYYHLRILDIAFITYILDRMIDFKFVIKTPIGGDLDLEDLENALLTQVFEEAFDETVDDHLFARTALQKAYEQQMWHFYERFWGSYFSNVIPIIIMDFFNFTHGLTLLQCLSKLDFYRALSLATVDPEMAPFYNPSTNLMLGWFLSHQQEEELGIAQLSRIPGRGDSAEGANPFQWANPNLNKYVSGGLGNARLLLEAYTRDLQNRATVLTASYYHMFESERKLYEIFDESLSNEEQTGYYTALLQLILSTHFLVNKEAATLYLQASLENQKMILGQLVQQDVSTVPMNYVAILNLHLTWFPRNGVPSFRYYIFNSYLKPVNLLGGDHDWYRLLEEEKQESVSGAQSSETWIETTEDMEEAHEVALNNDFDRGGIRIDLGQLTSSFTLPTLTPRGMISLVTAE